MFKTLRFPGKASAIFLLSGVLTLATLLTVLLSVRQHDTVTIDGETYVCTAQSAEDVVSFLGTLGYSAEKVSERAVTLPKNPNEVYRRYEQMMRRSGFSLERYRGEPAALYIFRSDRGRYIQILVSHQKIIAGHLSPMNGEGQMTPLRKGT